MSADGGRVTLHENVVFADHDGRELACDVFLPPEGAERPAPGLLMVHGGAWQVGEPAQLRGYGFLIGREGYVCVMPQYRLSSEATWPAPLHDVKAALRWMRTHAADLGLDPNRIAASGHSSGGHLAMMLAATPGHDVLDGDPAGDRSGGLDALGGDAAARTPVTDTSVQSVISFYGPSLLEPGAAMLKSSVEALMGPDAGPDRYAEASPLTYLGDGFPPTLLLHAVRDEIVPVEQSIDLYDKLRALDVPAELHTFDGCPHMFDGARDLSRISASLVVSFLRRFMPEHAPE